MWSVLEKVRQEKELYFLSGKLDIIILCKKEETLRSLDAVVEYMNVWLNCEKVEVKCMENLENLRPTCVGNINDDDEVIVLYRFTVSRQIT